MIGTYRPYDKSYWFNWPRNDINNNHSLENLWRIICFTILSLVENQIYRLLMHETFLPARMLTDITRWSLFVTRLTNKEEKAKNIQLLLAYFNGASLSQFCLPLLGTDVSSLPFKYLFLFSFLDCCPIHMCSYLTLGFPIWERLVFSAGL